MRIVFGLCVLCLASSAWGDPIYRYTDPATKREVFVNHLEQVPAALRDTARPAGADSAEVLAGGEPPRPGTEIQVRWRDVPVSPEDLRKTMAAAFAGGSPLQVASKTLVAVMDVRLKTTGKPGLYPSEVLAFTRWFGVTLVALTLASVACFVAWVIFLFHATRSRRYAWLVVMILVYPLTALYALLNVEQGRWKLRYLGFLAMISPLLVSLVGVWRFFAWFRAVLEARAGLG